MKSAEVWRFPLPGGRACALRVVLAVKDLGLPSSAPMAFVNDCVLVQIGDPGEDFDPARVMINGKFLSFRQREGRLAGFERVGRLEVTARDIEFPCWLIQDSKRGVLFCRGEIAWEVQGASPAEIYKRWDVRLSPASSEQLVDDVDAYARSRDGAQQGVAAKRDVGIPSTDIRYHPEREAILADTGVGIGAPYLTDLERYAPGRSEAYRRAINRKP